MGEIGVDGGSVPGVEGAGTSISGPGAGQDLGPDNASTLVTCQVPEGSCTPVDATTGARITFPVGAGDKALDLGATGGRS